MNGKQKEPSLRMEVVCGLDLWIWHLSFGFPSSMNDLNILEVSPHFSDVLSGAFLAAKPKYKVAGESFDWFYYPADGIYPRWKIFMTTVGRESQKASKYASFLEAVRKSVERVFGVLFKRFNVLYTPSRLWYSEDMRSILRSCCIIHNMLVEERRELFTGNGLGSFPDIDIIDAENGGREGMQVFGARNSSDDMLRRLEQRSPSANIKSMARHVRLKNALIDHIENL